MMNFSWAMDLDPKGLNNQIKEAVNKRYVTEDEDPLARLEADSGTLKILSLSLSPSLSLTYTHTPSFPYYRMGPNPMEI